MVGRRSNCARSSIQADIVYVFAGAKEDIPRPLAKALSRGVSRCKEPL